MHALSVSILSQKCRSLSVNMLLDMLNDECTNHIHEYLPFYTSCNESLFDAQKRDYITKGIYNTNFGDIVPLIMSCALKNDIHIIEKQGSSDHICHKIKTQSRGPSTFADPLPLMVYKSGEHYDAITELEPSDEISDSAYILFYKLSNHRWVSSVNMI